MTDTLNSMASPSSQSLLKNPPSVQLPALPEPRTIVCCFDGTGNKFGEENSNVVRFFKALDRDQQDRQVVYYQPGIGTYNKRQFITKTASWIASTIDQALALHLNDHVTDGYRFIMQKYRKGDKICLFGFSRGAYTARVIMGMLYKVGILPPDNIQQVDFAFSVYQMTGLEGTTLGREFKATFALPVTVEFVGVWDTVSSVGLIPRAHPYTSVNYAVRTFRHALALDERRARFRPKTWYEATLERELELDVDEPDFAPRGSTVSRDDWVYEPLKREFADVEEVWFSGCHADVGGGSHHNRVQNSLSFIPLRWMVKEAIAAGTGILFKEEPLKSMGFDLVELAHEMHRLNLDVQRYGLNPSLLESPVSPKTALTPSTEVSLSPAPTSRALPSSYPSLFTAAFDHSRLGRLAVAMKHAMDVRDAFADIYDQLIAAKNWWILEVIPMLTTYQESNGNWIRMRRRNFGLGRNVPFNPDRKVRVHNSVKERMDNTKNDGEASYKPQARNWDGLMDLNMIEWVS
ncbi:hypothetical protein BYT27DRAFT_6927925 [Phlegmacium glaucopus]|nr:hypothetical protein BYT27DRAFT_6927925 [Phlegmacium glaucopus]